MARINGELEETTKDTTKLWGSAEDCYVSGYFVLTDNVCCGCHFAMYQSILS